MGIAGELDEGKNKSSGDFDVLIQSPSLDDLKDFKRYVQGLVDGSKGEDTQIIKLVIPEEWCLRSKSVDLKGRRYSSGEFKVVNLGEGECFKIGPVEETEVQEIGDDSVENDRGEVEENAFWKDVREENFRGKFCGEVKAKKSDDFAIAQLDIDIGIEDPPSTTDSSDLDNNNENLFEYLVGFKNSIKNNFKINVNNDSDCEQILISFIREGDAKNWVMIDDKDIERFNTLLTKITQDFKTKKVEDFLINPKFLVTENIKHLNITQKKNELLILLQPNATLLQIDNGSNISDLAIIQKNLLISTKEVDNNLNLTKSSTEKNKNDGEKFNNTDSTSKLTSGPSSSQITNADYDSKARNFGELLDHSSNELSQLLETKRTNSPLTVLNYSSFLPSTSIRSTTPTSASNQQLHNTQSQNNFFSSATSLTAAGEMNNSEDKKFVGASSGVNLNGSKFILGGSNSTNNASSSAGATISRISSPLLTRMMDLSNIVEPTLDDPTLKLRKKVFVNQKDEGSDTNNPKLEDSANENDLSDNKNNSSDEKPSKSKQANKSTADNDSNLSTVDTSTNFSTATNNSSNNPTLSMLEDNDDNMLALSLASMANSRASSPRLTLPPINSAIDPNSMTLHLHNSNFLGNDFTPNMSSVSLSNTNGKLNDSRTNIKNENLNGASKNTTENAASTETSQPSSILSPRPSYNTSNLPYQGGLSNLGNMNNSSSGTNISKPYALRPSSPNAAKLPYIKRFKSPNIVTLNISRESSKSPVSLGDYRSPLGITNPISYNSNSNSSLTQLHNSETINANENENDGTDNVTKRVSSKFNDGSQLSSHTSKKQKLERKTNAASSLRKKTTPATSSQSQQNKFASNEIIMSENGKVYICQECKRQFSSGHHLTRHKKSVHSGEKPHSCPKCGKKFKRRDHVLQHLNKKIPCTQETGAEAGSIPLPPSRTGSPTSLKGSLSNISIVPKREEQTPQTAIK